MENLKKILKSMSLIEGTFQGEIHENLEEVSTLMSDILESNVAIINKEGSIISKNNIENKASFDDFCNKNSQMLELTIQTTLNHEWRDSYSVIKPLFFLGSKKGTIVFLRGNKFTYEDLILIEYISLSISMLIENKEIDDHTKSKKEEESIDLALRVLSYTEQEAVKRILEELEGDEGIIIASKLSKSTNITRSIIVNAIKKLEGSGVLVSKSLGMKGTYIKITNKNLRSAIISM